MKNKNQTTFWKIKKKRTVTFNQIAQCRRAGSNSTAFRGIFHAQTITFDDDFGAVGASNIAGLSLDAHSLPISVGGTPECMAGDTKGSQSNKF